MLTTVEEWLAAPVAERATERIRLRERVAHADADIQAWNEIAPAGQSGEGPLAGVPLGIKEIIETRGLLTEYGSALHAGRRGTADAAIVERIRQRGGVIFGKTRSTAFAYATPTITRNPRHPAHTPGGSSSGSAAAVAAGMVPVAVGTQTAGSVLRPASFCGVTGFKPTFDLLPMDGVFPFAPSLDTLGLFTHTAAGMAAVWQGLGLASAGAPPPPSFGYPAPLPPVDPPMAAAFRDALACLESAGLELQPIDLNDFLARVTAAHRVIMYFEGARTHAAGFREHAEGLGPHLAALVREGLEIAPAAYKNARRQIDEARQDLAGFYRSAPLLLLPAAVGAAPRLDESTTGDPRMNAPWTALGTPAISIPMPVSGLPLGLQLVGACGADQSLLDAAVRVERTLQQRRG